MVTRILLTYIGRVISTKGKLLHCYVEENGEKSLYSKPILTCAIGTIIECGKTDEGVKAPYLPKGKHKIEKDLTMWVEKDWANKKEVDIRRDIKKVPKTKYDNLVSELNFIISSLPRNQRLLFKMKLINDLRS